jgi:hypothetical protein
MVNPNALTLRRRSIELRNSADREFPHNEDSSALLLFYAAECALKSVYMQRKNLKTTDDSRGNALSARSYVHNLTRLIADLNIPRSSVGLPPAAALTRTAGHIATQDLHQAWRYGEKITGTALICTWLNSIIDWCNKNG